HWGEPLAHLKLDGVPVAWWSGTEGGVGPFAGTLRGAVELTMDDARRIRLRSTEPVQAEGVRLHTAGPRNLGPITAQANVDAKVTEDRFEATVAGCRVAFADGSTLGFDGSLAMPRDG